MPEVVTGTTRPVCGLVMRTAMPGSSAPTVPFFMPAALDGAGSTKLTEQTGDASVRPYPSHGMVPNFSRKAVARSSGSFSAPTIR